MERKKEKKLTWGIGIAIVLLAIVFYQFNGLKGNLELVNQKVDILAESISDDATIQPLPSKPEPTLDMKSLEDDDDVKGNKNAPVTIVEFSDFECPFCARFVLETLPSIDEKYIQTGKVKLIYRDYPLGFHADAQKAAEAAECAGDQDKYYEMHDKLFAEGVEGGVTAFKQYAKELELNSEEFDACLDSGKNAAEVQKDMKDGSALGIRGTPGFFINGKLISGAQPFSVFETVIEEALAK